MDHSFVVVEPDPIVRMDLAGALEDNFPNSRVEICASTDELQSSFMSMDSPVNLFVNATILSDLPPDMIKSVGDGGGRVVRVGSSTLPSDQTAVLDVPFSTAMILEAVSNVAPDPHAHQPEGHT